MGGGGDSGSGSGGGCGGGCGDEGRDDEEDDDGDGDKSDCDCGRGGGSGCDSEQVRGRRRGGCVKCIAGGYKNKINMFGYKRKRSKVGYFRDVEMRVVLYLEGHVMCRARSASSNADNRLDAGVIYCADVLARR